MVLIVVGAIFKHVNIPCVDRYVDVNYSEALRANVQPGILFDNGQSTARDDYSWKEVHKNQE